MIEIFQGRARSKRTEYESRLALDKLVDDLSPEEMLAAQRLVRQVSKGDTELLDLLTSAQYDREMVTMEQFLDDDYYMGKSTKTLYPRLREDMLEYDASGPYPEVILGGGIGTGKCVHGSTETYSPSLGMRISVRDAVHVGEMTQPAFDVVTGMWGVHGAVAMLSGKKELVRVRLLSGKSLLVSKDHPVLAPSGWVEARFLTVGDLVATPRRLPPPEHPLVISREELGFVTYMLTEGLCSSGNWSFTTASGPILEEFFSFSRVVSDTGETPTFKSKSGKSKSWTSIGTQHIRRKYALTGLAREKRLPAEWYGLSDVDLAFVLNRVWATDGHVGVGDLEITLASEMFVKDIQMVLLRFGIHSYYRYKDASYVDDHGVRHHFDSWRLHVSGGEALRFLDIVGPIFTKEKASEALRNRLRGGRRNTNVDVTPFTMDVLRRIRAVTSWRVGKIPDHQHLGMDTARKLFARKRLPGWCSWWLSDLFWDQVVEIRDAGECEVYDMSVPGPGSWVGDGVVLHNTTLASFLVCWTIYKMSCLRDPQASFGLSAGSEIHFVLLSKNLNLARRVIMSAVMEKIKLSPYFQEEFPFEAGRDDCKFPKGIVMQIGSVGSERVLGLNVFGAISDEVNFMTAGNREVIHRNPGEKATEANFDSAEAMYTKIDRRIKSRFMRGGMVPCINVLLSSKTTKKSFLDRRIARSRLDPNVFVREYANWEVKPNKSSSATFGVLVGSLTARSRIIGKDEKIDQRYLEETGSYIIEVPEDFRADFERDLYMAIRDIAGVSTDAITQFITRQESIFEAIKPKLFHPFSVDEYVFGSAGEFEWGKWCDTFTRKLKGGYEEVAWRPRVRPDVPRHVHVDVGISGDSLGIAMGHTVRWVEVLRRSSDGEQYSDFAPEIEMDFMLRIVPPVGEYIFLPEVRSMIYELIDHGFQVVSFSCDSYQSVEMVQQLRARGIRSEILSVDRTAGPYDALKTALYEHRIRMYEYKPFIDEALALERKPNGKIDHPLSGSKDVSDAVAGVVESLTASALKQPLPLSVGSGAEDPDGQDDGTWVLHGTSRPATREEVQSPPLPPPGTPKKKTGGSPPPLPFV